MQVFKSSPTEPAFLYKLVSVTQCGTASGNWAKLQVLAAGKWLFHCRRVTTGSVATSCSSVKFFWGTDNSRLLIHSRHDWGLEIPATNTRFGNRLVLRNVEQIDFYLLLWQLETSQHFYLELKRFKMWYFHHLVIANHDGFTHFKYVPEKGELPCN